MRPVCGGGLCLYRPHPVEESFGQQHRCCPAQHGYNRGWHGRAWGMGAGGHGPCPAPQQPASQPATGQPGYYVPPGCLVRQDFGLGQTRTKLDKARYLKEQGMNAPGQTCRTSLSRHFPSTANGRGWPPTPRFFNLTICQSDNLSAPPMRQPAAPYAQTKAPPDQGGARARRGGYGLEIVVIELAGFVR
jgi:hypothetical protein